MHYYSDEGYLIKVFVFLFFFYSDLFISRKNVRLLRAFTESKLIIVFHTEHTDYETIWSDLCRIMWPLRSSVSYKLPHKVSDRTSVVFCDSLLVSVTLKQGWIGFFLGTIWRWQICCLCRGRFVSFKRCD